MWWPTLVELSINLVHYSTINRAPIPPSALFDGCGFILIIGIARSLARSLSPPFHASFLSPPPPPSYNTYIRNAYNDTIACNSFRKTDLTN